MDIYEQVKNATSLAKSKKYDEAILLLNKLYEDYEMSEADIIKIIPYYQKAGRYGELENYCERVLIPMVSRANERNFSHKCKEIQHAFISLSLYKIYNKLELCAKREKINFDKLKFSARAASYYRLYEDYLVAGEKVELESEFMKAKEILGVDFNEWPEIYKRTFSSLIPNT